MSKLDIFRAALLGDRALIKELINSGADINAIHFQGKTPLLLAIEEPSTNVFNGEYGRIGAYERQRPSVFLRMTKSFPILHI